MDANEDIALPPLLERLAADARDVFTEHVLSRFDGGDLAVLALVSRSTRDAVFTSSVGEVNDLAAVRRELARVPKLRRVDRQAGVGEGARVSVEREDVQVHRGGWELEVAKWAKERGCPWDDAVLAPRPRVAATWRCCSGRERTALRGTSGLAAMPRRGGHLEVLQWARANGCSVGRVDLPEPREAATWRCCSGRERTAAPWDEWTCAGAAEGGHLEVLQWARANGAPWDERTCAACRGRRPPGGAAVGASERRSVGTRGLAPMPRMAATWRCCSGRERTALRGTSGLAPKPRKAATWRCCSGRERTVSVGRADLRRAAEGGHLEVLQWARANGAPWDEWTCAMPRKAATWRCCSGRERTALRGTRDLHLSRGRRPPGGATVGARERLLRGTRILAPCRGRRPPGGAAVGASERLLRGTSGLALMPRKAATWRCCSGRERTAAPVAAPTNLTRDTPMDGDHVTTTCRERVCYERTNERTNERVFFFIYFFMLLKHARAARRDRALPLHVVVVAARSAHAKFVFPIPSAA